MKFAHMADCHIGGWKDIELKELSIKAFEKSINVCIEENVGFVLIAGDLFNTSLPSIDLIKKTAEILNKLKEKDIDVYIIPGSHDFSPSGKTMIDVLENAGLVVNVMKIKDNQLEFTQDKTGVKITGLVGLRSSLDKHYYQNLDFSNLNEDGFKIFMLHNTIDELKPKDLAKVEGMSLNMLPKGFDYYAAGHVHYIKESDYDKGKLVYPGPLFPNNFKEMQELKKGGFYIYDNGNLKYVDIKLKDVLYVEIDANDKSAREIEDEILYIKDYEDKIFLLRVSGVLKEGKSSDINFKVISEKFKDSFVFLKNTTKLNSKEFLDLEIKEGEIEDVEAEIVKEFELNYDEEFVKNLMEVLDKEKDEGEKNIDFERRLIKDVNEVLKVN
tara:strand:+ start:1403 stop:2554 length:1152 start_codon:yes stop_codon:yes gene_type:complete